jgi:hypothetical protein
VTKLLDQTSAVEEVLVGTGLAPTEVVPLLVMAGRRNLRAHLDRIVLLGEKDLIRELVRWGVRLPPELIDQLLAALDRDCPAMPAQVEGAQAPAEDREPASAAEGTLLSRKELWSGLEEAAAREPIESWMTWLHPLQAQQVNREFSGRRGSAAAPGPGRPWSRCIGRTIWPAGDDGCCSRRSCVRCRRFIRRCSLALARAGPVT